MLNSLRNYDETFQYIHKDVKKGIIIWAVPRSRSTALERSFMQRSDAKVVHEHLTNPNGGQIKNPSDVLNMHRDALSDCDNVEKTIYVAKELTCYAPLQEPDFDWWLHLFVHIILVRDPLLTLASFKRVGVEGGNTAYFDPSEAGFREAVLLKDRILAACGKLPLIIDADKDLMVNPTDTLKRICGYCSIPYDSAMLTWRSENVKQFDRLKGWHDDVQKTTGFTDKACTEKKWLEDCDVINAANDCRVWYNEIFE